jgi:hypothetical protein
MKVVRENNEIKISLPDNLIDISEIQNMLDYIRYREIVSKSKATQKNADELAKEINKSWWDKNRHKFEK